MRSALCVRPAIGFNKIMHLFPVTLSSLPCLIYEAFNPSVMKAISTQQEILVITGTSFSRRQWSEKNDSGNSFTSEKEQLEKACWNGLIKELLPEIFDKTTVGEDLYLWRIQEADAFLELEFSEYPETMEEMYSINPHSFLPVIFYN